MKNCIHNNFLLETYFFEADEKTILQESFFGGIDARIKKFISQYKQLQKDSAKAVEQFKMSKVQIREEAKKIAKKYYPKIKKAISSGNFKKLSRVCHSAALEFFSTNSHFVSVTGGLKLSFSVFLTLAIYAILSVFFYILAGVFTGLGLAPNIVPLITLVVVSVFIAPMCKEIGKFIAIKGRFSGTYLLTFELTTVIAMIFGIRKYESLYRGNFLVPGRMTWAFMYLTNFLSNFISSRIQKNAIVRGKPVSGIYTAVVKTTILSVLGGIPLLFSAYANPEEIIKDVYNGGKSVVEVTPKIVLGLFDKDSEYYAPEVYKQIGPAVSDLISKTNDLSMKSGEIAKDVLKKIHGIFAIAAEVNVEQVNAAIDAATGDDARRIVRLINNVDTNNPEEMGIIARQIDNIVTGGRTSEVADKARDAMIVADEVYKSTSGAVKTAYGITKTFHDIVDSLPGTDPASAYIQSRINNTSVTEEMAKEYERRLGNWGEGWQILYKDLRNSGIFRPFRKIEENVISDMDRIYIQEMFGKSFNDTTSSFTETLNKIKEKEINRKLEIKKSVEINGQRLISSLTFENLWRKMVKLVPSLNTPFMIS